MNEEKLATELLHELKASAKRWFIAFIVVIGLWFATIGVFIWYISLPVEDNENYTTTVENEDGNANYISGYMSGVINNGENNSEADN